MQGRERDCGMGGEGRAHVVARVAGMMFCQRIAKAIGFIILWGPDMGSTRPTADAYYRSSPSVKLTKIEVYPVVTSISPSSGSLEGGTYLTLTGFGFDIINRTTTNVVTLGKDLKCTIVEVYDSSSEQGSDNEDQIVCSTAKYDVSAAEAVPAGILTAFNSQAALRG